MNTMQETKYQISSLESSGNHNEAKWMQEKLSLEMKVRGLKGKVKRCSTLEDKVKSTHELRTMEAKLANHIRTWLDL